MALQYHSQHEDQRDSTEQLKDSRFKMVLCGYLIPAVSLGVIGANFAIGYVYLPAGRFGGNMWDGLVESSPMGLRFAGVVTLKFGFAISMFSWYVLANHVSTERFAHVGLLIGIVVCILGLGVLAVSWL